VSNAEVAEFRLAVAAIRIAKSMKINFTPSS